MKLKRISVTNLFGLLNYEIDFTKSDTIIITGPNGYGKTMLLKIIDNIFNKNIPFFLQLNFSIIKFDFYNSSLTLDKHKSKKIHATAVDLISGKKEHKVFQQPKNNKEQLGLFDEIYDELFPTEHASKSYVLSHYLEQKRFKIENNTTNKTLISKYEHDSYLSNFIPSANITFIKAQRLEHNKDAKSAIEEQAGFLLNLIKKATEQSAQISQRLDSTFPTRLFDSINEGASTSSITDRLIGIQRKRESYMKFGLIKSEQTIAPERFGDTKLGKEYSTVLNLYISDALEKLSPYDDLFEKINLFVKLLNEKMLAFKEIKISDEHGFYFEGSAGDEISLCDLSSGEQNQIVIYFDLIFKTNRNAIIMIDEPEISLHVAWQKEFLESISRIQKLNEFSKIIIATHSPQIVNNNWDITYDLFENNKNK
ncbi:MAG: AAA family ATPase [Silvania sp.]|uniref:AAA family ATPase n=1 Tax=Silvania sp. TaxID=3016633 RepID=UPI000FAA5772